SGCRLDILVGPLNRNGPPMSQSDLDELMTEVNEVRNIDATELADIANIGAGGPCGEAHASVGSFVGGAACVTWDGDKYTVLAMVELGVGTAHTGAGLSGMISNAESHEDLEGNAWCVGGSGGEGVLAGGEVCVGYTDDWSEPTGIWTAAAAVQGGAGTPAEAHVTAVRTYEVFSLDPDSIPNPLRPVMDAVGDGLNSLRCIPNRC
ncbi:hypothetical protein, partial [Actinophytocola sp.]|uniref:hypothetical protein n=1 Tax=Actinophytocola sp. TaxID=1872138 RepID=UPI002D7FAC86